jgi:anthranilate phosphoribosyltransferase
MSKEWSAVLDRLLDGESMKESEAYSLMQQLAAGKLPDALAGALLAGLRAKGETADEIRGFATAMRELAVHPKIPDGAPTVDTVGTGGDGSGSLNLSTGAGLLAAACGARVVKRTCSNAWGCQCRCMNPKRLSACRRRILRSCSRRLIILR